MSRGGRGGSFCERVISRLRFFLGYIKVKKIEACTQRQKMSCKKVKVRQRLEVVEVALFESV